MQLYVYNHELELVGIIDTASSVIWHRRYYSAGDFEVITPATDITIELIQKQYIITKPDSIECGIIERVTIEQTDAGEFIRAVGRFGSSILARRIVFNTTTISDTAENAMRMLVYENAINPDNADRIIPNLELGTLYNYSETVQFQVSYRNLHNTLTGLSQTSGIGYRIQLDPVGKKLLFETYKSLDRSIAQSTNPRVIFSNDYDNLLASIYQTSDMEHSNVALVGGEGEGIDRKMVIVGSGSGANRYEIFVNAKEVRMEDEITEPEYYAMLAQKGAESLIPKVEYFEGNVRAESNVIYKVDYDLGDIVTIENSKWGKRINVQITEITEVYDENGSQIIPVFGQSTPTLQETLSGLEDTSGSGGGGSESATDILTKLLTVDGDGSGLDADLLDGLHASELVKNSDVNDNVRIYRNWGGLYTASSSNVGAIVISLGAENFMFDAVIRVWSYNFMLDLNVGGYTYTAQSSWYSPRASGLSKGETVSVRFYKNGSNRYIVIGDTSTVWGGYLHVSVDIVKVGLGSISNRWGVTLETSYPGTQDDAVVINGAGSGLDADLLDGKHASEFANAIHTHTASDITDFLNRVYPVGAIYMSVVNTSPATLFGGTWQAFGAGRTLVGFDSGQTEFNASEKTGGAKTHTLTESEMPSHTHIQNSHNHTQNSHNHTQNSHNHTQNAHSHLQNSITWMNDPTSFDTRPSGSSGYYAGAGRKDYSTQNATATNIATTATNIATTATNIATTATNQNTGGGQAHNNLQPYITVYMWKRTA